MAADSRHGRLRRSHAAYYLSLAEQAESHLTGADQAVWLDRVAAEHDNLRLALRWSLDERRSDVALRLAAALWRFWFVRGYLDEGQSWLEQALVAAGPVDPIRAGDDRERLVWYTRALNAAGNLARIRGEHALAAAHHETCLDLRRQLGDRSGVAASLNNLATVASENGDMPRALQLFDASLAGYRESGDAWATALVLNNMGVAACDGGDLARATACYEESLAIRRGLGDLEGSAVSLRNLAEVARERSQFSHAMSLARQSLALFGTAGHRHGMTTALTELGLILVAQSAWERGLHVLTAADALRQAIGATLEPGTRPAHDTALRLIRAALPQAHVEAIQASARASTPEMLLAEASVADQASADFDAP